MLNVKKITTVAKNASKRSRFSPERQVAEKETREKQTR